MPVHGFVHAPPIGRAIFLGVDRHRLPAQLYGQCEASDGSRGNSGPSIVNSPSSRLDEIARAIRHCGGAICVLARKQPFANPRHGDQVDERHVAEFAQQEIHGANRRRDQLVEPEGFVKVCEAHFVSRVDGPVAVVRSASASVSPSWTSARGIRLKRALVGPDAGRSGSIPRPHRCGRADWSRR